MDSDDKTKKTNKASDADVKDNLMNDIQNTKNLIESYTNNIHSNISIDEEGKPILIYEILNNLNNLYNNILNLQSNIDAVSLDNATVSELSRLTDSLTSIKDSLSSIRLDHTPQNNGNNSPSSISEIICSLISCTDALNTIISTRSIPKPPFQIPAKPPNVHEKIQSAPTSTSSTSSTPSTSAESTSQEATTTPTSSPTVSDIIRDTSALLININSIRAELIRLFINLKEPIYFNNSVVPLLTVLTQLSATSYALSSSQDLLSKSIITHAKRSKLKDTIHLIYNMNGECDDVYKELKRRIDLLMKI